MLDALVDDPLENVSPEDQLVLESIIRRIREATSVQPAPDPGNARDRSSADTLTQIKLEEGDEDKT